VRNSSGVPERLLQLDQGRGKRAFPREPPPYGAGLSPKHLRERPQVRSPTTARGVIAEKVISGGLWKSSRKTPEATISARLYSDIKKKGEASAFVKVSPLTFSLRDSSMEATNCASAPTLVEEASKLKYASKVFSLTDHAKNCPKKSNSKNPTHYCPDYLANPI